MYSSDGAFHADHRRQVSFLRPQGGGEHRSQDRLQAGITDKSYAGKWKVVFFWPKDFTFVCPTEIAAFGKLNSEFKDRDAQSRRVAPTRVRPPRLAQEPPRPEGPAVPDAGRHQARAVDGARHPRQDEGVACARRSSSIPTGIIRFVSVNDLSVGRNPQEVLRVLDALQTDELCPCNWQKGEDVLKAA